MVNISEKCMNSKYFNYVNELGLTLLDSLNNNLLFKQKLNILKVKINPTNCKTDGFIIASGESEFKLILLVNANDDERLIKFIISHELVHLLFASTNRLRITGYCSTDDTYDISNVRRISNDGSEYGTGLEEMLCDYIAIEILYRHYMKGYSRNELLRIIYPNISSIHSKGNYELIKRVIGTFGRLPNAYDKIDSLSEKGVISNLLLYTAVTGTLNVLVNNYDVNMGKNSWKRLNDAFEKYVSDNSDNKSQEIIEIELKRYTII